MSEIKSYWQNYIDGAWVDGGAGRVEVINPGSGAVLAEQALADAGDVDRAVTAAERVHLSGVLTALRLLSESWRFEPPPRILICGSLYLAGDVLAQNGTPPV